jgi:hypothetical protein
MMRRDVARLLQICAEELDDLDADWAVGGATAMAVHGYERARALRALARPRG